MMNQCHEVEGTHKGGIHLDTNILSCRLRIVDHGDQQSNQVIGASIHKGKLVDCHDIPIVRKEKSTEDS
jgi:hypothetical protein